jgi:hypothetical protein
MTELQNCHLMQEKLPSCNAIYSTQDILVSLFLLIFFETHCLTLDLEENHILF